MNLNMIEEEGFSSILDNQNSNGVETKHQPVHNNIPMQNNLGTHHKAELMKNIVTGVERHYSDVPVEIKESLTEVEQYLRDNYLFRFNTVKGKLEWKTKNESESDFTQLVNFGLNTLIRRMSKLNIKCTVENLKRTLYSEFTPLFNPFIDYSQNLSDWEIGVDRDYIDELASTITVPAESHDYWHLWFKKWAVAAIAGAVDPRVVNQTMLILIGHQAAGKTTWLSNLIPNPLRDYYYSGAINPRNKDSVINASECFLINIDDLTGFVSSKNPDMKELITKSDIRMRRPYGADNENMIRRASFVGSSNQFQFLNDESGSRRYLVFQALDIQYQHGVDIDMVWAQAYNLYLNGFQFWFEPEEINQVNAHNDKHQTVSLAQEIIQEMFELCSGNEVADLTVTTTKLMEYIEQSNRLAKRLTLNELGKGLRDCGFAPRKSNGSQLWDLKVRQKLEPTISDPVRENSSDLMVVDQS